jgi:dihydroflavonol-4-reductase
LDAQPVTGDLRDPESLRAAVAGCGLVFHVAADYRLWARDADQMYRSNVDGTQNLLAAARDGGVERCVYTSTVGCIHVPNSGIGDETQPVKLEEMKGPYKRSKFLAEEIALRFGREGFPVVIVNPTAPVGDHDWKPTPTGRIVLDFLRGEMPAYIDTGLNLVDVKDVAAGHLLACERGRVGERYVLGCENVTLAGIFEKLERLSGRKAPTMRVPYAVAYAAGVVSTAWAGVSGREPRAPIDAVRMAKEKKWVSHRKASAELGYEPGSVDEALRRAVEWFRTNGYVA